MVPDSPDVEAVALGNDGIIEYAVALPPVFECVVGATAKMPPSAERERTENSLVPNRVIQK